MMGNCHARFLGEGGASNGAPLPGTRNPSVYPAGALMSSVPDVVAFTQ